MRKIENVSISGDLRSLYLVAYRVIGIEANRVTRVYESCRIEMSQALFSKPRLRTI